jgi:hypothetical protein
VNIRLLSLVMIFWSTASTSVELVFRESHFLNQYRHEIYLNAGQYVYIDDHFTIDRDSKWVPNVPIIKAKVIDLEVQLHLLEQLIELGVKNWKPEYPEDSTALICDGLSFTIYVKSEELNIYSSGGCRFPPNYEKVREILVDL